MLFLFVQLEMLGVVVMDLVSIGLVISMVNVVVVVVMMCVLVVGVDVCCCGGVVQWLCVDLLGVENLGGGVLLVDCVDFYEYGRCVCQC